MSSTPFLRQLLVGRRSFILSHLEFKKIMLTGQLALIIMFITLAYSVYDLAVGIYGSWPFQLVCAVLAFVGFLLNRRGHHTAAKVLLAIDSNITVLIFTIGEPVGTEINIFFIVIGIATLAGFGYEQRRLAILFVMFTFLCYLSSLMLDVTILPRIDHTEEYLQQNGIINFIAAAVSAILIVYSLITVNYHSEFSLRKSEEQLTGKNDDLTRLNIELDKFVYSSSHDLKAPLQSIRGLIELTRIDPENQQKYIGMIHDRVTDLEKFIEDIAAYSKNSRASVNRETFEVAHLLREVLETLRFYPEADQLSIHLHVPDGLVMKTDKTRLKIIMTNLVSNCYKYCDKEKKEKFVRITAEHADSLVTITVQDNGLGIRKEDLGKIFEMFYRAHSINHGSGLGLYIVKENVDKLGGTIQVESTVAVGTTFKVSLPSNLN